MSSGKVVLKILSVFLLAALLFVGAAQLLHTEPFEQIRHQSAHSLVQLNLMMAQAENCDEPPAVYVPSVRRQQQQQSESGSETGQEGDGDVIGGISSPGSSGSGGFNAGGLFDFISWLFIIGIAVLAVVLLYMLVNHLFGSRAYQSNALASDENDDLEGMAPLTKNPIKPAEGLADQGDYRAALRLLYRGILGRLIKLGLIDGERHRTNWEVMRLLQREGHSEIHRVLFPVTQLFDRAWYGQTAITADEFHRARDATQAIMQTGESQ